MLTGYQGESTSGGAMQKDIMNNDNSYLHTRSQNNDPWLSKRLLALSITLD